MERAIAYLRQHLLACIIGASVLCIYGYLSLAGEECFNCEETKTYKTDERHGSRRRFHK